MKDRIQKWSTFIGKSMLWSLLLYLVMMVAVNWDEINNSISGKNKTTIVTNIQPGVQDPTADGPTSTPVNISHPANALRKVLSLLSGVVKTSVSY